MPKKLPWITGKTNKWKWKLLVCLLKHLDSNKANHSLWWWSAMQGCRQEQRDQQWATYQPANPPRESPEDKSHYSIYHIHSPNKNTDFVQHSSKTHLGTLTKGPTIKLNRDANTHHRCSMLVFHPCWPATPSSTHLWIWHLKRLVQILQLFQAQQCCLSWRKKQMFLLGERQAMKGVGSSLYSQLSQTKALYISLRERLEEHRSPFV